MNSKQQTLAFLFSMLAVGLPSVSSPETPAAKGNLQNPSKLPMVSAQVSNRELLVIYNIPEGQHATVGDTYNFMIIQVSETPGLTFGETIYPKGKKDVDGNTEYCGTIILRKSITVLPEYDFSPRKITITAGYQLCHDSGVCMPPKKETFDLMFTIRRTNPETK